MGMRKLKIVVEHHEDGYVAYPVGLNGIVLGEGDSLEAALTDVRSAIEFHMETFGKDALAELPEEVILTEVQLAG
jgi:predicted RNase H-like HicB family nuclease